MENIKEIEKKYILANSEEKCDMMAAIMQDLILMTVEDCKQIGLQIRSVSDFRKYYEMLLINLISNDETWKRFLFLMLHNLYDVDRRGIERCIEMYIDAATDRYNEIKHML